MSRRWLPFLLLAVLFAKGSLHADETWVELTTVPWTNSASAIVQFNSDVIVAGLGSDKTQPPYAWISSDAVNWTATNLDRPVSQLMNFNGLLYGFSDAPSGQSPTVVSSLDGLSWQSADHGEFGANGGSWITPIVNNGELYATDYQFNGMVDVFSLWHLINSNGQWEKLTLPFTSSAGGFYMVSFNNHLVLSYSFINNLGATQFGIAWSSDGISWTDCSPALQFGGYPLIPFNGTLYLIGAVEYWSTTSGQTSADWVPLTLNGHHSNGYLPFLIRDQLHLYTSIDFSQFLTLTKQGLWSESNVSGAAGVTAQSSLGANYLNATAEAGEYILVRDASYFPFSQGAVFRLKLGLQSVVGDSFFQSDIPAGQKNQEVLAWSVAIQVEDTITSVTLKNLGTAQSGRDIAKVHLLKILEGTTQLVTDLVPNPDGSTWTTPTGFSFDVLDGDKFAVSVDIANSPQVQATCRFSIPPNGVTAGLSKSFSLSAAITAPNNQTIVAGAVSAAIDGVLVYPKPSRDLVNFLYDLDGPSNVKIRIFDLEGKMISEVEDSKSASGRWTTAWDGSKKAPGAYYASVTIQPLSGAKREYKRRVYLDR
jgi:hypothetical protein